MEVALFIIDKLIGAIFPFLKRSVVVSPKIKKIETSGDPKSTYRYFVFLINQKDKPLYNLNLRLSADAENMPAQVIVVPNLEGQEYKPIYPLAAGNTQDQPIVDIGFMGVTYNDSKHFSYNLRVDHIDPRETKKLEVVISNLNPNRKIKMVHELTFSKNPESIEVRKGSQPGQVSVSVQGLNWKVKK
ncbi:MAG: hypothetical protein AAB787_02315 [Patescibacteria group bacterium]